MSIKKLKNPEFSNVNTILFDFGNVILDIDISLSINEFKRLGISGFNPEDIHPCNSGIFYDIEIGKITSEEFIATLKQNSDIDDQKIEDAWNRLLLDYDYKRFELISELRQNYRVAILSNTNKIHHDYFEEVFNQNNPFGVTFKECFDHVFYSDEMGCRKPDQDIYLRVADILKSQPSEMLFIDDNAPNLEVPAKLGWSTHHLKKSETILQLFE